VSKYKVSALIQEGSKCQMDSRSRSARAYVVKKGYDAFLYLTPSGIRGLSLCAEL
jgi:hypothetical protein